MTHTQDSGVCHRILTYALYQESCHRTKTHVANSFIFSICSIPPYSYLIRFERIHSQCPLSVASLVQCSLMGVMSEDLGHWSTFHTA